MGKEYHERLRAHVTVGTIGHIDAGKTWVAAAIIAAQESQRKREKALDDMAKLDQDVGAI